MTSQIVPIYNGFSDISIASWNIEKLVYFKYIIWNNLRINMKEENTIDAVANFSLETRQNILSSER